MSRYHEANGLGSDLLSLFGLPIPEGAKQIKAALDAELAAINALIGGRRIESLIDLPMMQDPEMRMAEAAHQLAHVVFLSGDKPLTLLNTARMVQLSLTHGNSENRLTRTYSMRSMHVVPVMEDYKSGYEFGLLAQRRERAFSRSRDARQSVDEFCLGGKFLAPTHARLHPDWP
jgi:predicted ATPase